MAFMGVDWRGRKQEEAKPKGLGEACGGEFVEECRKLFGDALEKKICIDCSR